MAELDFVRDVAFAVSQSLKTAAQFQGEREVANAMQQALLRLPEGLVGIDYAAKYTSASEIAEIGGDFYDLSVVAGGPGRHRHRGRVRPRAGGGDVDDDREERHPRLRLRRPAPGRRAAQGERVADRRHGDEHLRHRVPRRARHGSGALTYCSAGHPPAFLRRASGELVRLEVQSPLLGGFGGFEYVQADETLERGDYLFLYTDGAYEAHGDGEMFGEDRLAELVRESSSGQEACDLVSRVVTAFSGGRLEDDLAMLAVSLRGPSSD